MNPQGTVLNPRHTDRPVVRTDIDGLARVQKRYRSGSTAIYQAMEALWESPFGAGRPCPGIPRPLTHHADDGVIEMSAVDGVPLSTRGAVERLPELLGEVAALLADLHCSGVVVERRRDPRKVMRLLRERLDESDRPLIDRLDSRAPRGETMCLNHGDFSPRNVMQTAHGPVLIDLDRLQMAGPGRDLNHLGAWCWATIALGRDRSGLDAWELCDAFEAAYLERRPEAAADVVAGRAFHRSTALVRIATEWSAVTAAPEAQRLVLDEAWRLATWRG